MGELCLLSYLSIEWDFGSCRYNCWVRWLCMRRLFGIEEHSKDPVFWFCWTNFQALWEYHIYHPNVTNVAAAPHGSCSTRKRGRRTNYRILQSSAGEFLTFDVLVMLSQQLPISPPTPQKTANANPNFTSILKKTALDESLIRWRHPI